MNQKNTCSVIIIAKNEADRVISCIEHAQFAQEIILVDNGSTDDTRKLAQSHHAIVVALDGKNFSALRMLGANTAKSEWLLYIDADETITPELVEEIQEKMHGEKNAYFIPRINYYLGHRWPAKDKMVRLIRKSALRVWVGELHEHAEINGEIGEMKNALLHDTHRTLREMIEKTNEWSETEARLRIEAHHPPMTWWRFIRVMWSAFWYSFIRQGGWRAGISGWIESIYQAFSMFITYAKLWELQQK